MARRSFVKKTKSGRVDLRTRKGREIYARMAKARAVRKRNALIRQILRMRF